MVAGYRLYVMALRTAGCVVALVVAGVTVLPLAAAYVTNTALASLPLHAAPAKASPTDSQLTPPALKSGLRTHCLDCHDGARGKGGLDLNMLLDSAQPSELLAVSALLALHDMPPIYETELQRAA